MAFALDSTLLTAAPLDWQQRALDSIHVFEVNGPSTCVFLAHPGYMLKDHSGYEQCLPIELFDPRNEHELHGLLKRIHRDGDVDIEKIRNHLNATRPEGYTYRKTPEEELQIKRVFVELNKYPEISSELFNTMNFKIVVGRNEADVSKISELHKKDECIGYYSANDRVAGITVCKKGRAHMNVADRTGLRFTVAEEVLHAIDHLQEKITGNGLNRIFPLDFIDSFSKHTAHLDDLRRRLQSSSAERLQLAPEEWRFVAHLSALAKASLVEEYKEKRPQAPMRKFTDREITQRAGHLLENMISLLKEGHEFREEEGYKDLAPADQRKELFGKLSKNLLLARHRFAQAHPEDFKAVEKFICNPYGIEQKTNPLLRLLDLLDKKELTYHAKYSKAQRERAETYAEAVAREVEHAIPSSTRFAFKHDSEHAVGM